MKLYYDEGCLRHANGPHHPERPERLSAIKTMLASKYPDCELDGGRDATPEELALVHDPGYLERLADRRGKPLVMLDPDTGVGPDSFDAALRGAGMCVAAALSLFEDGSTLPFAFPRPPGHHAEASRAMGFCLLGNVAIAARALQRQVPGSRVAIVDYDVHHGNGTQSIFYDDASVLYISLHQWPLFPGSGRINEVGRDAGEGFTINIPLSGGKGDREYIAVMEAFVVPVLAEFEPDAILVSAGFDAHGDDPLAGMTVTSRGYEEMTARLIARAAEQCNGRIAHVLEGGYDLSALAESVEGVLAVLAGRRSPLEPGTSFEELERAMEAQRPYWSAL